MKIVVISESFSKPMGYIENLFPRELSKLGHEVYLITSNTQVYYNSPDYDKIYEPFLGEKFTEVGREKINGFEVIRLPFGIMKKRLYLKNISRTLQELAPDIVQTFNSTGLMTFQAAFYQKKYNYKLFTGNHIVASVFPNYNLKNSPLRLLSYKRFLEFIVGRYVSKRSSQCFPATVDAEEIAIQFFGVDPTKSTLFSLGVNTDLFCPEKKTDFLYEKFNIPKSDLVCLYSGRFTEQKNPYALAQAIQFLRENGEKFSAIFVGDGPQKDQIKSIQGCYVHDFVKNHELPNFYQNADVGVWPRQESLSMIDATACGLPIIVSDKIQTPERVEGNGFQYKENDYKDLAANLLILKDQELREKLGNTGAKKIKSSYSWEKIVRDRVQFYENVK